MISRYVEKKIIDACFQGKTLVLYGPRQSGKTTLMNKIGKAMSSRQRYISGDFLNQTDRLKTKNERIYAREVTGLDLLIIDEAQRIHDIGLCLKALHDAFPTCQVIATGSSSFELAQHIQEPLTGRKEIFFLLPFGIHELYTPATWRAFRDGLSDFLVYGMYPAVYTATTSTTKEKTINEITDAYLFKDIFLFEGIKKSDLITKLAKLLAFQIGKPISLNELATKLQISVQTVERYITILEQAFIVFRVGSWTKNLRKELARGQKIYFRDLGIRNALIGMQQPLETRADVGELRENFVIAETMKKKYHTGTFGRYYFRKTYDGQELDLLYVYNEQVHAFEIKRKDKPYKPPIAFTKTYPQTPITLLTHENFLEVLSGQI